MRRYLLLFIPFMLVGGCAPRPVFRMKPAARNTTFNEGVEYVIRQKDGIKMTMSYYRHVGDRFLMDVEVDNNTNSIVRLNPTDFSYQATGFYRGQMPGDSAEIIVARQAINPEQKILQKDLDISRSRAHQKTNNLIYGISQAALLTTGAILDSTQTQRNETSYYLQQNALDNAVNNRERKFDRLNLRDQRAMWEQRTIRKTDLFPGDYIEGLIFFKNEKNATGYIFHATIAGVPFRVFFTQQKFLP